MDVDEAAELARTKMAEALPQLQQATDREAFGRTWQDTGLVFTTRSGLPLSPAT